MGISPKSRRGAPLAMASLLASYVHHHVRFGHHAFESVTLFVAFWLAHYVGFIILLGFTYVIVERTRKYFLGRDGIDGETSMDEIIVCVSVAVLVASALTLIAAHWQPSYDD